MASSTRSGQNASSDRQRHFDSGPHLRRAAQVEARADRVGALAHAGQAEVAGGDGDGGVEASPVVGHAQAEGIALVAEPHLDASRASVSDGVGERLLRYAEQIVL